MFLGVHYLMLNPVKNKLADTIWLYFIVASQHPHNFGSSVIIFFFLITLLILMMNVLYPQTFRLGYRMLFPLIYDPGSLIRTLTLPFFFLLEHLKFSCLCYMEQMSIGRLLRRKATCAHWNFSDSAGRHKMKCIVSFPFAILVCLAPQVIPVNSFFYIIPKNYSHTIIYSSKKNGMHFFACLHLSVHLSFSVYPNER